MSTVNAAYIVNLESQNGLAKVVGVTTEDMHDSLLEDVKDVFGAKYENWFWFGKDDILNGVVDTAQDLDTYAEIFDVEIGE
jgi:hypothetical protein